MLPGMIEVSIIGSGVVPDPLALTVDMRSVGAALPVTVGGLGRGLARCGFVLGGFVRRTMSGRRTMAGNVSAADFMAASHGYCVARRPARKGSGRQQEF